MSCVGTVSEFPKERALIHHDVIDRATPLAHHQALPLERLRPWLSKVLGSEVQDIELARFGRGFSNLTFLLRVGERELVLRRPPPGVKIARAHDMGREYRIVESVGRVWSRVPRTVAVCHDPEILGGSFYLMDRLSGVILRQHPPQGLVVDAPVMTAASRGLVDTLAEIHGLDVEAAGLSDLGRPQGYVSRQVEGWTRRYARAKTDDVPDFDALAAWLTAHQPALSSAALIHNDFKYDNVILSPDNLGEVLAVLDWEMATVGDPRMDLGTMLAYWV
jgi:aminoglycoside phosphotransferase (APT) family kinase protein